MFVYHGGSWGVTGGYLISCCFRWTKPCSEQLGHQVLLLKRAAAAGAVGDLMPQPRWVVRPQSKWKALPSSYLTPPTVAECLGPQTPHEAFALFISSFIHSIFQAVSSREIDQLCILPSLGSYLNKRTKTHLKITIIGVPFVERSS